MLIFRSPVTRLFSGIDYFVTRKIIALSLFGTRTVSTERARHGIEVGD